MACYGTRKYVTPSTVLYQGEELCHTGQDPNKFINADLVRDSRRRKKTSSDPDSGSSTAYNYTAFKLLITGLYNLPRKTRVNGKAKGTDVNDM